MEVQLTVNGKLKLNASGRQVQTVPLRVDGQLLYEERMLAASRPLRAVRHYREAEATIQIGKTRIVHDLSADHRLIAVRVKEGQPTLFCPGGHLTRDELDLIDVQGNSALIAELLPRAEKKVGDHWRHSRRTLAALLGLEAISQSDVTSELLEVKDGVAVVQMVGSVSGAVGGVATEIQLKGKYHFALEQKQISWLVMAIRESRSIGHAEPGFEVAAQLRMAIRPIETPEHLGDAALSKVALSDDPDAGLLRFESAGGGFQLLYDRRWRVMIDQPDVTILRMIDRGDLLAQCNISKLADLAPGQHLALEKFQADVQKSLGEHFGQFVEASQSTSDDGLRILRVAVAGLVSGLPIHWIYYHIADEQGRRISYVFTMEGKYVERFAAADSILTSSLQFPAKARGDSDKSPTIATPPAAVKSKQAVPAKLRR